jgi:hypothetical protein
VLKAARSAVETTKVMTEVSQALHIVMANIHQYYLLKSIVKAYLRYWVDHGQVEFRLEEDGLLW